MLIRMWSKENTPSLLVRMHTSTTIVEINVAVSQTIFNSSSPGPNYTTPDHIPKRYFTLPQGYWLNCVYSSFIHNSQKLEITQMSFSIRMDTEHVVYLHNGILLLSY